MTRSRKMACPNTIQDVASFLEDKKIGLGGYMGVTRAHDFRIKPYEVVKDGKTTKVDYLEIPDTGFMPRSKVEPILKEAFPEDCFNFYNHEKSPIYIVILKKDDDE